MSKNKHAVQKRHSSKVKTPSGTQKVVMTKREAFSGPLPPPQLFAEYEKTLPGASDRIMKLAEREQRHQHKVQNSVISANVGAEKLGMIFGFVFQMSVVLGLYLISVVLFINDKDKSAVGTLFVALASSGAFIYKNRPRSEQEKPSGKTKS